MRPSIPARWLIIYCAVGVAALLAACDRLPVPDALPPAERATRPPACVAMLQYYGSHSTMPIFPEPVYDFDRVLDYVTGSCYRDDCLNPSTRLPVIGFLPDPICDTMPDRCAGTVHWHTHQGRTGKWYLVTLDDRQGWVNAGDLRLDGDCSAIPLLDPAAYTP